MDLMEFEINTIQYNTIEYLCSLCIWYTHISDRIYGVNLVIRVEVTEWSYTSTIDCHTDRVSWIFCGIIYMKVVIMSVAVEYSCYCVLKPEN
jgi:hypothetical protein